MYAKVGRERELGENAAGKSPSRDCLEDLHVLLCNRTSFCGVPRCRQRWISMSSGEKRSEMTSSAPSVVSVGTETIDDRSWLEGTLAELGSFFYEDLGPHTDRAVWSLLQLACFSLVRTVSAIRAARSEVIMLSHRSLPAITVQSLACRSSSNPVVFAKPCCVSRFVSSQQVLYFLLLPVSRTTTRIRYARTTPKNLK